MRICVFCGSSAGESPDYGRAARVLGAELARRQIELVYGGARVGTMGVLASAALDGGGTVIGVIPSELLEREIAATDLPDLRIVGSLHERKALMADLADAFIALPGGVGTLDELFDVLSQAGIGRHAKPVGLLDVRGYYRNLIAFLDHAVSERFVAADARSRLVADDEPIRLLDRLVALAA